MIGATHGPCQTSDVRRQDVKMSNYCTSQYAEDMYNNANVKLNMHVRCNQLNA